MYELRARARADEGGDLFGVVGSVGGSTSMEIVDAPTVRLLPRIADGAAAVEVKVPPGGKPMPTTPTRCTGGTSSTV